MTTEACRSLCWISWKPNTIRGALGLRGSTTLNSLEFMASEEDPPIRAVAKVPTPRQQRGVARVPETIDSTSVMDASEPSASPVFVDDSGRRGRAWSWVALLFALIGLALLAALWWSQAAATGG
jgi:hypothetical protein